MFILLSSLGSSRTRTEIRRNGRRGCSFCHCRQRSTIRRIRDKIRQQMSRNSPCWRECSWRLAESSLSCGQPAEYIATTEGPRFRTFENIAGACRGRKRCGSMLREVCRHFEVFGSNRYNKRQDGAQCRSKRVQGDLESGQDRGSQKRGCIFQSELEHVAPPLFKVRAKPLLGYSRPSSATNPNEPR